MSEDKLSAYSAVHTACPELWNKLPFSAFTMLLYLAFRGSGRTWHMESQEFGPCFQNSSFIVLFLILVIIVLSLFS
jgi:hypothetical protein